MCPKQYIVGGTIGTSFVHSDKLDSIYQHRRTAYGRHIDINPLRYAPGRRGRESSRSKVPDWGSSRGAQRDCLVQAIQNEETGAFL